MKLLHLVATLNPASGGPAEIVRQIAPVHIRLGHDAEVVTLDAPQAPWLSDLPFPVHAMGPSWGKYGYTPRLVPWLRANAGRYDVVIIHGIWQYHCFGAWRALRHRVPYVVFPHGMLAPWFKRTHRLKHLKKWLYWPWADYRVLRDASAVLFTCEEERRAAHQSFWLYRCTEKVVGAGVAAPVGDDGEQRDAFYAQFSDLQGKRLVLFLGRLHYIKGCDLLIEAFARVCRGRADWHLVMAGPDQLGWQKDLRALAGRLGIGDRITWAGMLTGDVKWGAYRAAEVFALPSHHENFSMVVAESLTCGLPVLISNGVNIWREVQADGAGLVANDDLEGVCSLLQSWLDMSSEQKERMRQQAHRCFAERFEIGRAAEALIDVATAACHEAGSCADRVATCAL
jgi:glycosyltransferase involved in cell wall biosynthesis